MICEIINPSDAYTMECENFVVGVAAVAVLGNGHLGLKSEDGEQTSPILFGWEEWFAAQDVPDLSAFVDQNKLAIAAALASVRIGRPKDRQAEAAAVKYMSAEDAEKYRTEIHDVRRTSMNDIGGRAWQIAKKLRDDSQADVPPEGTIVMTGP
jgi:hypothetical protein